MRTTTLPSIALIGFLAGLLGLGPPESVKFPESASIQEAPSAVSRAPLHPRSQTARASTTARGRASSARSPHGQNSDDPRSGRSSAGAAEQTEILDAEWTVSIQPNATITIMHRGFPVVRSDHITWAEKNVWAGNRFSAIDVHRGSARTTGLISKLDLTSEGSIRPLADNALKVTYNFRAARGHAGIKGTVIDWRFVLNSPTFDARPAAPVLLDNKMGWTWPVGPNQTVTVRFDEPLDDSIYEAGRKDDIHTFLFAKQLAAGPRRISYTVQIPDGGRIAPSPDERYGPIKRAAWFRDALKWDESPIDLSFLNAADRPAGRRGFLKADGDRLVFEDGTPARFWGGNLAALALFATPRENVPRQARRMAQLGFNLMRIHQHDAAWANPNIFVGHGKPDTRHLEPKSLEAIDWWIKCLKDEGIYVWIDLNYNRNLTAADGVSIGWNEVRKKGGMVTALNYFNQDLARLMLEFQHSLLKHVNRYTGLAYKDDPAVVGILITNENELTNNGGNHLLADKNVPVHNAIFEKEVQSFARQSGLPVQQVGRTWEPGPSKVFLNEVEHRFNHLMIDDLRRMGVRAPLATTNLWGDPFLFALPALSDGDVIDIHSYGKPEDLSENPHYAPNIVGNIGLGQVEGKPVSMSEWNVPYPAVDRFTTPLYIASVAALQGWDMPMIYNYSQGPLRAPGKPEWARRIDVWSTYIDPSLCGVMPAAALAFRRRHVSPARTHYCLMLDHRQLFNQRLGPKTAPTLRTLVEQSRLTIGYPAIKELPWLRPTEISSDATVVTDPNHDYIPAAQSFVRSDTGELLRNWKYGIHTINTPKTQAVSGWIGGKNLQLADTNFRFGTPKAVVALSSVDDQPLANSHYVLITTMARAVGESENVLPFLSEPVVGVITFRTKTKGLELHVLGSNGRVVDRITPTSGADGLEIRLPAGKGTHWYALKASDSASANNDSQTKN
jgi:hypothetical protein